MWLPDWYRAFLAVLPIMVIHTKIAFSHLGPHTRTEAVQ